MAHYDCDDCGAGLFQDHSDACVKKSLDEAYAKKIELAKKPPIGLRPKHIVDAERIQEIKEAIVRYVMANMEVPKEWQQELYDLRGSTF